MPIHSGWRWAYGHACIFAIQPIKLREICPHAHTSSEGHIPKYIVHDMLCFRPPPEPILLLGVDVGIPWIKMNNKGVKLHVMVLLNNTTKATIFFPRQSLTTKNVTHDE